MYSVSHPSAICLCFHFILISEREKTRTYMLKMDVVIPQPQPIMDFDFNDARSMPFLSAPSSPKRFGDFSLSAPTSPSRMAEIYRYFDEFEESTNGVPFTWEEKPGTPKSPSGDDFAFDFKSELEHTSLSAEELFDGGIIKPLKPPPRLQFEERNSLSSPSSPIAQGKKIIREIFSPRKKKDSDPFDTATENTGKRAENERGRERTPALTTNSSRRAARSLSPCRVSTYPWEEDEQRQQELLAIESAASNSKDAQSSTSASNKSCSSSSRKWRLKDFLLFRSASEGRASDKNSMSKYPSFFRKPDQDAKNSSFRSTDSSSSAAGKGRKRQVSAHELHYTMNKAATEDLKKKTFLPYKYGILGRFAFNPTVVNGFGSLAR